MSDIAHGQSPIAGVMRDPMYLDSYANQLRVAASISDLTIIFGVGEDAGQNRMVIRDKAAIRLAPSTMKILSLNLQAVVDAYEQVLGQIPIPAKYPQQIRSIKDQLIKTLSEQADEVDSR